MDFHYVLTISIPDDDPPPPMFRICNAGISWEGVPRKSIVRLKRAITVMPGVEDDLDELQPTFALLPEKQRRRRVLRANKVKGETHG